MKKLSMFSGLIIVGLLLNSHKNDFLKMSLQNTELPKMDLHFHLNYEGQSLANAALVYEKAAAFSKEKGVILGIAEEFVNDNIKINDSLVLDRVKLAKKNSLYLALQVSRRDWHNIFSKDVLKKVDYILPMQ